MRCVEWSAEYVEAHVIAMLLRAHDVEAVVFDENFVRQNWFELLGDGGFRIMSPEQQLPEAKRLVAAYRSDILQVHDTRDDEPECPHCGAHETGQDPQPRRMLFLVYIVFGWLIALVPMLIRRLVVGRYRCRQCRHTWHEPRSAPFGSQQRDAESALAEARQ